MTNIKTLTLAAVTALSLGIGTAMAQESGAGVGPYETMQLQRALSSMRHAAPVMCQTKAGSSDVGVANPWDGSESWAQWNKDHPESVGGEGSG